MKTSGEESEREKWEEGARIHDNHDDGKDYGFKRNKNAIYSVPKQMTISTRFFFLISQSLSLSVSSSSLLMCKIFCTIQPRRKPNRGFFPLLLYSCVYESMIFCLFASFSSVGENERKKNEKKSNKIIDRDNIRGRLDSRPSANESLF